MMAGVAFVLATIAAWRLPKVGEQVSQEASDDEVTAPAAKAGGVAAASSTTQ
jgi:hypothetical protein